MFPEILSYLRCPGCCGKEWKLETRGLICKLCQTAYPIRDGVLDMLGDDSEEVITPFQRLMQTPMIVTIYEKLWRQIGYYAASSRSFNKELQTVLRLGGNKSKERTLDLACGTGVFTRPLAHRRKALVVGLDLSWPMLRQAQRLVETSGIQNILLVRASAFALPFADAAFSHVNCCGALHLFDRPDAALREVHRILCPSGHLCVQTTIRPNRSAGFAFFLERFIRFGFFNEAELRKKIKGHGFTILESERHRISFTFLAQRAN
jgi:ubiquinone/menaquinone biosynthesis C-methylase UbiE/uncharacterized protein YbaR (Trm112 family)